MSHCDDDPIKHKWQRAGKIARGKLPADELLTAEKPKKHEYNAHGAFRRRCAQGFDDTEQLIDSFFELT